MSAGDSAWNSGLNPLNRTVRSRAGRRLGHRDRVALAQLVVRAVGVLRQRDVALADQVAVLDRGVGRLGHRRGLVDLEGHQRPGAVLDLDVLDRADLDAGDPDVVALDHAGRVHELGLVGRLRAQRQVADRRHEHAGRERRDDDEDEQLDQVAAGLLVEELHEAPRQLARRLTERHRGAAGQRTDQQQAEVGDVGRGHAQARREQVAEQVGLRGAAGVARDPEDAGVQGPRRGGVARGRPRGPLAGRLVDAVLEVGLAPDRVALRAGRVGQVDAGGAPVLAELGHVLRAVGARLVGQRLQHDVEGEAAERLGLELAGGHDALEQAGELGRVAGEHPELGPADLAEPDHVGLVVVEERPGAVGEVGDVGEQRVELDLAVLERAGRGHGVLQDRPDLGQHVGVDVGDLRGEPEVLDQGRDLRVEALEVAVDGLEVLAELVAAALERRRDRVERHVELGRLDRAQQRVEVGEDLLDLGGDLGALDGVAGLDGLVGAAGRRRHERDVLLAEQGLGDDRAGDVGRDRVGLVRDRCPASARRRRRWTPSPGPRRR